MRRVLIIATGGTIASMQDERGLSPQLTGTEIAAYVPHWRTWRRWALCSP